MLCGGKSSCTYSQGQGLWALCFVETWISCRVEVSKEEAFDSIIVARSVVQASIFVLVICRLPYEVHVLPVSDDRILVMLRDGFLNVNQYQQGYPSAGKDLCKD